MSSYTIDKSSLTSSSEVKVKTTSTLSSRYVLTSLLPVLTAEEIISSVDVHNTVNEILRELLTENDLQLIANILDQSGRIILTKDQLITVLLTILSLTGTEITSDNITIKYSEDILSKCLKTSVSPFKTIVSIKVLEQELSQVQPVLCSVITSTFKISLDTFYEK